MDFPNLQLKIDNLQFVVRAAGAEFRSKKQDARQNPACAGFF